MRYLVGVLLLLGLAGAAFAAGGETCETATVIPSLPYWDSASTEGYINNYELDSTGCTMHTTKGPDAVYKFTSTTEMGLSLYTVALFESWNVSIYILTDCENLVCVAGADANGPGSPEALFFTVLPGQTYYFVVDGRDTNDYGLYKIGIAEPTDVNEADILTPSGFKVIPTVSSKEFKFDFSLRAKLPVELVIYDASGRRVAELYKGITSGESITWSPSNLKSGVYFARLSVAGQFYTKALLYTK